MSDLESELKDKYPGTVVGVVNKNDPNWKKRLRFLLFEAERERLEAYLNGVNSVQLKEGKAIRGQNVLEGRVERVWVPGSAETINDILVLWNDHELGTVGFTYGDIERNIDTEY